ncbi:MAG TPA: alpha/beta hydrolase [Steroidobacteraceae bacterium]|nr:alpha/beta hydrolase [Steroidobacteraceae bacterium]
MLKRIGIILGILVVLLAAVWLKLRGPDIPYETLEAKYTNGASRFIDLPGGFHVHYQDDGDLGAPTVVLLHGYGDSYTSWEGWVQQLKTGFHLLSLDFPGHGLTRAPEGYSLSGEGLADFVDAFAAQLNLPQFAVAGNSMGGGVAWQLALRHPQRLNALILVDAAGFPNEKPPAAVPLAFKILKYPLGRALLRNIDNRPLIDEGLRTDVFDKALVTPALVDRWAEFQRAPGHRAILMSVSMRSLMSASPEVLRGLNVPTLILHGQNDVLIEPASAGKFAAAIPGAKVVLYPNVGHLPQIEIPQRSSADVAEFLKAAR